MKTLNLFDKLERTSITVGSLILLMLLSYCFNKFFINFIGEMNVGIASTLIVLVPMIFLTLRYSLSSKYKH